jgi:hypothetical protein
VSRNEERHDNDVRLEGADLQQIALHRSGGL